MLLPFKHLDVFLLASSSSNSLRSPEKSNSSRDTGAIQSIVPKGSRGRKKQELMMMMMLATTITTTATGNIVTAFLIMSGRGVFS